MKPRFGRHSELTLSAFLVAGSVVSGSVVSGIAKILSRGATMETLFTMGLMVLLAIMFALTLGISGDTIPGDVLGARGFPLAMIVLGFVLCILILVRQARTKTEKGSRLLDLSRPEGRAALAACGALVAYIALLNFLGYILSTLLFSVSAARLTGFRKVGALVLFAVMTTAVLFLLFAKLFFVPLPRGAGFLRELSYLIY